MTEASKARKSVMLVEDVAVTALAVADALEDAGYNVLGPCASCSDALAVLSEARPDYAILDITLRESSCLAAARELRKHGIPFLVYSGWAPLAPVPEELREARWLEKPVSFDALIGGLETLEQSSQPGNVNSDAFQISA